MASMSHIRKPQTKPRGREQPQMQPLPIIIEDLSGLRASHQVWPCFRGVFTGTSVVVSHLEDAKALHKMGCFGHPMTSNFEATGPTILRRRQYKTRREWASKSLSKTRESRSPEAESESSETSDESDKVIVELEVQTHQSRRQQPPPPPPVKTFNQERSRKSRQWYSSAWGEETSQPEPEEDEEDIVILSDSEEAGPEKENSDPNQRVSVNNSTVKSLRDEVEIIEPELVTLEDREEVQVILPSVVEKITATTKKVPPEKSSGPDGNTEHSTSVEITKDSSKTIESTHNVIDLENTDAMEVDKVSDIVQIIDTETTVSDSEETKEPNPLVSSEDPSNSIQRVSHSSSSEKFPEDTECSRSSSNSELISVDPPNMATDDHSKSPVIAETVPENMSQESKEDTDSEPEDFHLRLSDSDEHHSQEKLGETGVKSVTESMEEGHSNAKSQEHGETGAKPVMDSPEVAPPQVNDTEAKSQEEQVETGLKAVINSTEHPEVNDTDAKCEKCGTIINPITESTENRAENPQTKEIETNEPVAQSKQDVPSQAENVDEKSQVKEGTEQNSITESIEDNHPQVEKSNENSQKQIETQDSVTKSTEDIDPQAENCNENSHEEIEIKSTEDVHPQLNDTDGKSQENNIEIDEPVIPPIATANDATQEKNEVTNKVVDTEDIIEVNTQLKPCTCTEDKQHKDIDMIQLDGPNDETSGPKPSASSKKDNSLESKKIDGIAKSLDVDIIEIDGPTVIQIESESQEQIVKHVDSEEIIHLDAQTEKPTPAKKLQAGDSQGVDIIELDVPESIREESDKDPKGSSDIEILSGDEEAVEDMECDADDADCVDDIPITESNDYEAPEDVEMDDTRECVIVISDSDCEGDKQELIAKWKPQLAPDTTYKSCDEALVLGLEEAFFLLKALGCLNVFAQVSQLCRLIPRQQDDATTLAEERTSSPQPGPSGLHNPSSILASFGLHQVSDEKALLSPEVAWQLFASSQDMFPSRYVVYHYYRAQNFVVKSGLKFGGDFLLYREGPSRNHASYVVLVQRYHDSTLTWQQLMTANRIAETTKKEVLLTWVQWPNSGQTLENLPAVCVWQHLVTRHKLTQQQQQNQQDEEGSSSGEEVDSSE